MTEEPSDQVAEELARYLERYPDTAYVDAIFVDLCGIVRGKRYPRAELEKLFAGGFPIPFSLHFLDVTGACLDPCGRGFSDGDPDGVARPVPGTLAPVPWADRSAGQVLMSLHDADGRPSAVEPRNVAAAVARRFEALGLRPCLAFELEFFLIDRERDDRGRPQPPRLPTSGQRERTTQVYGMDTLEELGALFHDIEHSAAAQGVPASVATSEYAPGQYEINLRHVEDPVLAADHCALLRRVVKAVARRHGLDATFMSKPFLDQTGNGMHVHASLLDAHGKNVFDDGSPTGSETLRHALGGLLHTLYDAMALFAPSLNALRRFGPNLYVPVNRSWGSNNRSVALRIPAGASSARRFEHRVPGADANPYLVLAAILAGMHHGITHRVDPGAPWSGNVCGEVDPEMPREWAVALQRFSGSTILREYLGADYVDLYCATKNAERLRFLEHISRREYDWYL
ncbi:MAG: glutamine synthetase [Ectothiorhodospiraceae bacterium]|nr:glutamine synthetase [Chromatiales bacterium]MCP5155744.1 glutamine synthetase [Ectothiorhodospiraceae bacterium]